MSAPPARRRRRDEEGGDDDKSGVDQQATEAAQLQSEDQPVSGAQGEGQTDPPAAGAEPPPQSAEVQPLPEQFSQRKKQRRSAQEACHLDKLATVELQLCLQFLDRRAN
jgi:hypothetical protein